MPNNKTLIVSALVDIGRANLSPDFGRDFNQYLTAFEAFLQIPEDMYLFVPEYLFDFIEEKRPKNYKTSIEKYDVETIIENFNYLDKVNEIRNLPDWYNQADWLKNSPQARLELYNPLVMQKMNLLAKASNSVDSNYTHTFWLDAGITQTVHPGYFTHDKIVSKLPDLVDKFMFICYPYFANSEIHGFERKAMAKYANVPMVNRVARGGFFGGKTEYIADLEQNYNLLLSETLNSGYMGTEESIFTLLTYLFEEKVNVYYIEGNGLISGFMEDVKNNTVSLNPKKIETIQVNITNETLAQWHLDSEVHFSGITNRFAETQTEKSKIAIMDIGSSTGIFLELLSRKFEITQALLIDPLTEAIDFATNLFKGIEGLECIEGLPVANQHEDLYLNVYGTHNGNLGIFTINEYPDVETRGIKSIYLTELLSKFNKLKPDFVRIHTGNYSLKMLEIVAQLIKSSGHQPLIGFDYGYYESREKLAATLFNFDELGYVYENPFNWGGGDFFIYPNAETVILPIIENNKEINQIESNLITLNSTDNLAFTNEPRNHDLTTYIVTYNLPEQLNLLFKSFHISGNYLLYNTNLVLIDNSDDTSVFEAYTQVAKKYNMEHIRMGNLGISGARQLAADHFHQSNASYMLFFEDDMLLSKEGDAACSTGLVRYVPDLFQKVLRIYQSNHFDFIKLSFTEFFGNNATQWAWHNVPQEVRAKLFPDVPEKLEGVEPPKTVFSGVYFEEGLAYCTGDVYYSNWPHLIGKEASIKMFENTRWNFPAESTWMSHFYQLTREGQIHPAILLATPINHHRAYHYKGELRKEYGVDVDFTKKLL